MSLRTARLLDMSAGSGGAGTYYSLPFLPDHESQRVAGQAKRLTGSGTITVTLQGGWADSQVGTATDWVDIDLKTGALSSAQLTDLKPTSGDSFVMATYPQYRVKYVVAAAAATGSVRILFF